MSTFNLFKIMKRNIGMLALIMAFWFTISFITNILGPLIPDIIHNFNLSDLAMAGFIPTSFFLAYAIMSIPAGLLIDRFGEKPVLFGGFLMPFIGTILFCLYAYLSDDEGRSQQHRIGMHTSKQNRSDKRH